MARNAKFTVRLAAPSARTVTVNYSTVPGTAESPSDFINASGKLTFAPGEIVKYIDVTVRDHVVGSPSEKFSVLLSSPVNAQLNRFEGFATLGTEVTTQVVPPTESGIWMDRFNFIYNLLTDTDNGFFGPATGPKAFEVPYHAKEREIIIEAPDWSRQSVSETVSFWVKLEAWKTILSNSTTGLERCWNTIEKHWIPTPQGQPWREYNVDSPATYVRSPYTLNETPIGVGPDANLFPAGVDPIANALEIAYGTKDVYLMHWMMDVDGDYNYRGPDGDVLCSFINNYQRGPVEDGLATITHPCWDDFENGGSEFGWQALYGRSIQAYANGDEGLYSRQAVYSMAGDADVRAVGNIHNAMTLGSAVISQALQNKAAKMADYTRYTLFDKYFLSESITGDDGVPGCHYLLSWGMGFGCGIPDETNPVATWGFRIGNSEIHHGYNGIDVAYACRTGGDLTPLAAGSQEMWSKSLDRQLEMLRWLQSPEGPIAGGVTSCWLGRYEVPTDGRQTAKFYGMYYTYSPSWFNPPSNNWIGFQSWGFDRIAAVYVHASMKSDAENIAIADKCEIILEKFLPWLYNNTTIDLVNLKLEYPVTLYWGVKEEATGATAENYGSIPKWDGRTITFPRGKIATELSAKYYGPLDDNGNLLNDPVVSDNLFEYLPTLEWPPAVPSAAATAAFWARNGSVPNPDLHCVNNDLGFDHGTASGFSQVITQYCHGKKLRTGSLTGNIPNSTIPLMDLLQLSADMMEYMWQIKDADGFGSPQAMNYDRLNDKLWIPPEFGTGTTATGEILANGQTTFLSMRASMYGSSSKFPELSAWLTARTEAIANGTEIPAPPTVTYHRFWNGADAACAFAMLQKYFPDVLPSNA